MPVKLGAHMSIAGGCDRAVLAAARIGFQTVQLFTKNNNQWKAPPLTDAHVAAFRDGAGRDRDRRAGGAQLVPDQPGQSRRRPLEQVDRRDDGGSRALRGAGDRRPGGAPGGACRSGEEAGLARVAAGARRGPSPDPGRAGADRPGNDRRSGDLPGPPLRAPGRDPRPGRRTGTARDLR